MILRDYQGRCVESIFKAWETVQSTLAVLPTGSGKTVIFAHVIKALRPKRVMVLAHRNELILQAKEKIERVTGLEVEIEKAGQFATTTLFNRAPIVVSSIQTQISGPSNNRRYLRFNPLEFGALVYDEAHHILAPSGREVVGHYCKNPALKVLGVTATPDRADSLGLKQMFASVAFNYGILDAIKDGWLVDITQQFVPVKSLDFSHVRTAGGDLNEGDLAKLMQLEENIQGICQPSLEAMHGLAPKSLSVVPVSQWSEYLAGCGTPRRTIVFTVSVAQAEMCANVFSRAMKGVEWVCGKTPEDTRAEILKRFASGQTHCVCNCGVLLEGFDNPAVELIAMARPTKSRSLYAQCVGRSLRPLPGLVDGLELAEQRVGAIKHSPKPFARILDFVGNAGRHKLISCVDILGGKVSEEAAEAAKKIAMEEGKVKRILVTMDNAQIALERKRREEEEQAKQAEEARRRKLLARVDYSVKSVNPFGGPAMRVQSNFSRDGRAFSAKQARVLIEGGLDPSRVKYQQGQAIIGKLILKPSPGQRKILEPRGISCDGLTRKECSAKIDAIAQSEGWGKGKDEGHAARLAVAGKESDPF